MKRINIGPEGKKQGIATRIILILPALLSAGFLGYIEYRKRNPLVADGVLLSPPVNNQSLVTALIVFTVGYLVFILMMFSEDIKDFFSHKKEAK